MTVIFFCETKLNNFPWENVLGMVCILNFRDDAQKTNRASTLQKLYDRNIFFFNPGFYNFP